MSKNPNPSRRPFSSPRLTISLVLGILTTALFYIAVILPLKGQYVYTLFLGRSPIQPIITFLFFWSLCILALKMWNLSVQGSALRAMRPVCDKFPAVSPEHVDEFMEAVSSGVKNAHDKAIVQRFLKGLSYFKSSGNPRNAIDSLRYDMDLDMHSIKWSLEIVKYFTWIILILGILATMLGVNVTMGGFEKYMKTVEDVTQVKAALVGVTTGLTANFSTTLLGLMTVVPLLFLRSLCQRLEENLLISIDTFCQDNLISRLVVKE